MKCFKVVITGVVQGVGFRPFVYTVAAQMGLKGRVGNDGSDVVIMINAGLDTLAAFIEKIRSNAPVLSKIASIEYQEMPYVEFEDFHIEESRHSVKGSVFISPDVCTCEDCLRELKDNQDRRHNYPFINCTNCGPRFTIIKDIPYDRDKTTMESFEMCGQCKREYLAPADRRYHAQPVSCHDCGPVLSISDVKGNAISDTAVSAHQCIEYIAEIIKEGKIAAIKGIGGYHLACDGTNAAAVERLRKRKHRDDKPFAVMMKDVETTARYCRLDDAEISLLKSPASPIVLLRKISKDVLPDSIARLNPYLGVMLPYTPIHHLLFAREDFPEALVMTSGNLSSEPIFYEDSEALEGLLGIADAFLTHDREIHIRTDDSVTRIFDGKEYILRRSRGYVPRPVRINLRKVLGIDESRDIPSILACGGELKNVFCLNKGELFYLSHHIGDLENDSTNDAFRSGIAHFKRLFDITPACIAHDLHPGYYSSQYAGEQNISQYGIQHHKAHIASCMAENELAGEVIGVSFDGTGFGEDGKIWGGEFFSGGYGSLKRKGHLEYVGMPGGDSAVKHPWRMAVGFLYQSGLTKDIEKLLAYNVGKDIANNPVKPGLWYNMNSSDIDFMVKMLERKLNCPKTSSMGRLFDAVSALLGIKTDISYEGQAAVELEYYAVQQDLEPYGVILFNSDGGFVVNTTGIIKEIIRDIGNNKSRETIASRFHCTIAEVVLQGCLRIRLEEGLNRAVLSGGVFQNLVLLRMSVDRLMKNGFEVYVHSQVPANDGGIALGQAMIALAEYFGVC